MCVGARDTGRFSRSLRVLRAAAPCAGSLEQKPVFLRERERERERGIRGRGRGRSSSLLLLLLRGRPPPAPNAPGVRAGAPGRSRHGRSELRRRVASSCSRLRRWRGGRRPRCVGASRLFGGFGKRLSSSSRRKKNTHNEEEREKRGQRARRARAPRGASRILVVVRVVSKRGDAGLF